MSDIPDESGTEPAPITAEMWIEQTLRGLTIREKVGQLLVPRISGAYLAANSPEYQRLREWVTTYGIGGVVLTHGPPLELAAKLNLMQSWAKVPLLVTADMEHGPGQILQAGIVMPYGTDNGTATRFPPVMGLGATGDPHWAYELGRITALEGAAVGVHMTYAPVVDVNNNPNNPIINTRSYSEDPALVAKLAAAHVRGLQAHGMLATAKHFPGHGDTGTDSHMDLPVITVSKQRADTVELRPYRSAIEAGVAAVMTAHIAFPALTGDSLPATLSSRILTGLLRGELKFPGVIITDAMDMSAITRYFGAGGASIMAIKAGADALLQPHAQDVPIIANALEQAVLSGDLTEARVDQSVRKLLEAKAKVGLHRQRQVDLSAILNRVAIPEHLAVADSVAERSITALRDRDHLLPLRGRVVSIVYADDPDPWTGRTLQRSLTASLPNLRTVLVDTRSTKATLDSLHASIEQDAVILFSPFIRVSANKGELSITPQVTTFVRDLIASRKVVVTSFGNPYILTEFPEAGTYLLAWGQWDVSQRAAARALLGQAPITGKLPIAIPPLHKVGDGLRLPLAGARR
jgi:beta-N-acetylhexosaminidase